MIIIEEQKFNVGDDAFVVSIGAITITKVSGIIWLLESRNNNHFLKVKYRLENNDRYTDYELFKTLEDAVKQLAINHGIEEGK